MSTHTQLVPWPRRIINFPIILIAICVQAAMAVALVIDPEAHHSTNLHTLFLIFPEKILPIILFGAAMFAAFAFAASRKLYTILLMTPQQLLLYMSAGGSIFAVISGHYADGVIRSHSFLFVDQCPNIFLAAFHTWAIILILLYGED